MIKTTLLLVFQSVLEWSVWSGVLLTKNIFELHICCLKLRSSSNIKILLVYVTHDLFLAIRKNCLVFPRRVFFLSLVLSGLPVSYLPHIHSLYSVVLDNFYISYWTVNTFNIILLQIIVIFTKNHLFNSICAWLTHHFWTHHF